MVCCLVTFLYVVMLCGVVFCCSFTSADLHYKSLNIFSCKSSLLFLGQRTVIVLFFYCVMWPLKRNLVRLKNAGRCSPLCCYVALMFCCYVPIRYVCYVMCLAVSRCIVLFGCVAFDCFALWCVLLWWAVRCCIMVIASCTRNVSAHGKRRMLSVDGSEWVNTLLVFRLVNVAETLAVSSP